MNIRTMRESELDEVIALWHATQKDAYPYLPLTQAHTLEDDAEFFKNVINQHNTIWVAEQSGRIVGFMAINGSYIDRLYISPAAQRQGIGAALMAQAKQVSPVGLELHTHDKNKEARQFYEKHGFQAAKFGISPPPESEPDVEYHWRPE